MTAAPLPQAGPRTANLYLGVVLGRLFPVRGASGCRHTRGATLASGALGFRPRIGLGFEVVFSIEEPPSQNRSETAVPRPWCPPLSTPASYRVPSRPTRPSHFRLQSRPESRQQSRWRHVRPIRMPRLLVLPSESNPQARAARATGQLEQLDPSPIVRYQQRSLAEPRRGLVYPLES